MANNDQFEPSTYLFSDAGLPIDAMEYFYGRGGVEVVMTANEFAACFVDPEKGLLGGVYSLKHVDPGAFLYAPDSEKSCPLERAVIKWRNAVNG